MLNEDNIELRRILVSYKNAILEKHIKEYVPLVQAIGKIPGDCMWENYNYRFLKISKRSVLELINFIKHFLSKITCQIKRKNITVEYTYGILKTIFSKHDFNILVRESGPGDGKLDEFVKAELDNENITEESPGYLADIIHHLIINILEDAIDDKMRDGHDNVLDSKFLTKYLQKYK